MVAVITGNGLGIGNSSLTQIGQGPGGSASLGQDPLNQYVNAANGNLVLQTVDEGLLFDGLPLNMLRTYNSQGQFNGQNDWSYGFSRSIGGLTGTLNTVGSTITRTGDDGSTVVYAYDADRGLYVSTGQSGALDTLSWSATNSTWTWSDAADQQQETYDASGELTMLVDTATGASYSFSYANGHLSQITAGDGDVLKLDYNTGGQLVGLEIQEVPPGQSAAVTRQQIAYGYDASGRLTSVTTTLASDTDATPGAASYTTTYTYDGDSDRIASVTQSDGTTVSYTYTQDAQGAYQVTGITTGTGAAAQALTLSYGSNSTIVTNALGQATTYQYNTVGQLLAVIEPAVNGVSPTTSYTYDANGNPLTMTDANGAVTSYQYDANGNLLSVEDGAGNTVSYTYNAGDQVTSRTSFTVPAQGEIGESEYVAPSGAQTTYYIYDGSNRLAFAIDPLGDVTAYTYASSASGASVLSNTRHYRAVTYDLANAGPGNPPSLTDLQSWSAGETAQRVLGQSELSEFTYDVRGQLSSQTQWDGVDADGNGVATDGTVITTTSYDAQGRLLQSSTYSGGITGSAQTTSFSYDGLGRLIGSIDPRGNATSFVYDDSNNTLSMTQANGLVTTQVRNSAGLLVSSAQMPAGGNTEYFYDSAGRQVAVVDPLGNANYTFYDADGRVAGTVDAKGDVTAYTYDADGRSTRVDRYAATVDSSGWLSSGALSIDFPTTLPLPTSTADDLVSYTLYDQAGRVAATIDAAGGVEITSYDGAGNVIATVDYATALNSTQRGAVAASATPLATLLASVQSSPADRTTVNVYDGDNRIIASVDPAGTVHAISYDAVGNVVASTTYGASLNATQIQQFRSTPTMAALQILLGSTAQTIYDAQNHPVATIGSDGKVTVSQYDAAGHRVAMTAYATALTPAQVLALGVAPSLAAILASVSVSANDQTSLTIYDVTDYPLATVGPDGSVTTTVYDGNGNPLKQIVWATKLTTDELNLLGTQPTFAKLQADLSASAGDLVTLTVYDGGNRPVAQISSTGVVTVTTYDAQGRQTAQTIYAETLNPTQVSQLGDNPSLATLMDAVTPSAGDQTTLTVYDADGHVVGQVASNGIVTITHYDSAGNVLGAVTYATPLTSIEVGDLGSAPTLNDLQQQVVTNANDATTLVIYDAADNLSASIDSAGNITLIEHDPAGHVVATTKPYVVLTSAQMAVLVGSPSWSILSGYLSDPGGGQMAIAINDAQGHQIASVDAQGNVSTIGYDAEGRVSTTVQYQTQLTSTQITQLATDPSLANLLGLVTPNDGDAATLKIYDASGRVVASLDDSGTLTTTGYDAFGHVASSIQYQFGDHAPQLEALGGAPSMDQLQTLLAQLNIDQATASVYDKNGHVIASIGDDGFFQTMQYDVSGHLVSTVHYDQYLDRSEVAALGPAPTVAQVQAMFAESEAYGTVHVFDAQGREIGSIGINQMTVDHYDANGNKVAVLTFQGSIYNERLVELAGAGDPETLFQQIASSYVASPSSINLYDTNGRQVASVDSSGNVSVSNYDADGNKISVISYSTELTSQQFQSLAASPSTMTLQSQLSPSSNDAVQLFIFDANHHQVASIDPNGIVVVNSYDGDGRLITETQYAANLTSNQLSSLGLTPTLDQLQLDLSNGTQNQTTLTFYDTQGRVLATVVPAYVYDPATSSYGYGGTVTINTYNDAAHVVTTTTYQQTITPSQLQALIGNSDISALQTDVVPSGNDVTSFTIYDDQQRVIAQVSAPGSYYDRSIDEWVDGSQVVLTTYGTNGTESIEKSITYAHVLTAAQVTALGVAPTLATIQAAVTSTPQDTVTLEIDDASGRPLVLATPSAPGRWPPYQVTVNYYDSQGHLTSTQNMGMDLGFTDFVELGDTPSAEQLIAQWLNPGQAENQSGVPVYDAAGREVASIEITDVYDPATGNDLRGGIVTTYGYDANGNIVVSRSYGQAITGPQLLSLGVPPSWPTLQAILQPSDDRDQISVTIYDANNRPVATVDSDGDVVFNGYDANGNLTETISYANQLDQNQLDNLAQTPTLQQLQGMLDPSASDQVDVSVYDASGRIIGSVDTSGQILVQQYDAAGRLVANISYAQKLTRAQILALGSAPSLATLQAAIKPSEQDQTSLTVYDTQGRVIATVIDGVAHVSTYDSAGNIVADRVYAQKITRAEVTQLSSAPTLAGIEALISPGIGDDFSVNIYDQNEHLVGSWDSAGNVTLNTYNDDGQIASSVTYADVLDAQKILDLGEAPTFEELQSATLAAESASLAQTGMGISIYGDDGRLTARVDPNGSVTFYDYNDADNAVTQRTYSYVFYGQEIAQLGPSPSLATLEFAMYASNSSLSQTFYDASGQVIAVVNSGVVTTTAYDSAGRVTAVTTYGVSLEGGYIGSYSLLLQQLNPDPSDQTAFTVYDAQGHVVATVDATGKATINRYDASGNQVSSTSYATLLTEQQREHLGSAPTLAQLQGILNPVARTIYNAANEPVAVIDANGNASYAFYNSAGQLVEQIDNDGDVTSYSYDASGNVVQTIAYATRVDTSTWFDGSQLTGMYPSSGLLPSSTGGDRVTTKIYDSVGQLVAVIDPDGNVTTSLYDALGDVIRTTQYAMPLSLQVRENLGVAPTLNALNGVLVSSGNDRTERAIYDVDGNLVASIDAAGYATIKTYDASGNVILQVAYATALSSEQLSTIDAGAGLPTVRLMLASTTQDQATRTYFDAQGRPVAEIDAAGYLTVLSYDIADDTTTTQRYATALTSAQLQSLTGNETVAGLIDLLPSNSDSESASVAYNSLGQVASRTGIDGTVTTYLYDGAGRVISTTITPPNGQGEARTTTVTYDALGNVSTSTDATGAVTTYQYDAAGHRTKATNANGDSTWYYYDAAGRLSYQVKGQPEFYTSNVLGDVTAYQYDAFGDVTYTQSYAAQLVLYSGSGLGVSLSPDSATLQQVADVVAALGGMGSGSNEAHSMAYDGLGHVVTTTDGDGYAIADSYDAFGDLVSEQQQLAQPGQSLTAANSVVTQFQYDARGEQIAEIDAAGTSVARTASDEYDAFGRLVRSTDANGHSVDFSYDNLGNQLGSSQVVQGVDRVTQATYDAFGKVLSQTDALGNVVRYQYDVQNHVMTVTTPSGVVMTTVKDAFGDTVSITDGAGNTTSYVYDEDGRLLSTTDALGATSYDSYDAVGNLVTTTDATGDVVQYQYDASGRVLVKVIDPHASPLIALSTQSNSGLNIYSFYQYDGIGRTLNVVDGENSTTTYRYDADGNVLTTVVDAGAGSSFANAQTSYTYDGAGNALTVTQGANSAAATTTQYVYDPLGRLVSQTVDPSGLALTTSYAYDSLGNIVKTVDPLGNAAYAIYDEAGEAIYTVQPAGAQGAQLGVMTQRFYDADGNLVATSTGSSLVDTAGLSANSSESTSQQLAAGASLMAAASSSGSTNSYSIYNADGRQIYQIDALGNVIETRYNALGQVQQTLAYASPIAIGATLAGGLKSGNVGASDIQAALLAASDSDANARVDYAYYDADGRLVYSIVDSLVDGVASAIVSETRYDAAGRVVADIVYGDTLSPGDVGEGASTASIQALLSDSDIQASAAWTQYFYDAAGRRIATTDPNDNTSYVFYDNDNRVILTVDGAGAGVAYIRDTAGRVVRQISYAQTVDTSQWMLDGGLAVSASDAWSQFSYEQDTDRVVDTTYDSLGRVTSVTQVSLQDGDYYDPDINIDIQEVLTGETTYYTYDAASRLIRADDDGFDGGVRSSYTYYDADGHVIGKVDASGHLTTYGYDAAGQLARTTAYATAVNAGQIGTAALDQLIPSSSAQDQITSQFYDAQGNCIGVLDADGYFTGYAFDQNNREISQTRYTTLVASSDRGSLASILASLAGTASQQTTSAYDAYGDIVSRVNPSGTQTQYIYDQLGHVIQETVAAGTDDARTTYSSYDALGNLTSSKDGLGNVTSYTYDDDGNRLSMTDALGNTSWYVYDPAGRLVYTIRGEPDSSGNLNVQGEVSASSYDAFGDVTSTSTYANRMDIPAGFSPTIEGMDDVAASIESDDYNTDQDALQNFAYDLEGNLILEEDGNGNATSFVYDGYNEVVEKQQLGYSNTSDLTTLYAYDDSGHMISQIDESRSLPAEVFRAGMLSSCGSGEESILREQEWTYDAFGRVATFTDGNGATTSYTYDDLGQQLSQSLVVQGSARETSSTYDAYGRVVSTTDALDLVTTYSYDDSVRSITVTAPGGLITTMFDNREGQAIEVIDPAGNATHYQYDQDGRLLQTTNADNSVTSVQYDAVGDVIQTTDADGHVVNFTYDAMGRVLSQVIDPDGLALTTTYQYDGRGLAVSVTDPTGALSTYTYDGNGNISESFVQKGSEQSPYVITTRNYYDTNNKLIQSYISSTDPSDYASWNYYQYDALGRLTEEQTSTGRTSETQFSYDADGNLVSKTDGNDNTTYYVYNEADEPVYSIAPTGGNGSSPGDADYIAPVGVITQNWYNADGQLVATRQYANTMDLSSIQSNAPGIGDIASLVVSSSDDRSTYKLYNANGQLQYSIDATGTVTETRYNSAGQVAETLAYANPLNLSTALVSSLQSGSATPGGLQTALVASGDTDGNARVSYAFYDSMGRVRFTVTSATIDGQSGGLVTGYEYDADGNAITQTNYGQLIPLSQLGASASTDTIAQYLSGDGNTHVTHNVYDDAGRLVYTVNAAGYVSETQYDADGRITWNLQYANAIGGPASWDQADVASAVALSNTDPSTIRGTGNVYDLAGNLIQTLDKLSGTPVASYTYNALGLKTSYTNRDGQTWTYQYDSEGNLVDEFSPPVSVVGYSSNGSNTGTSQQSIETYYSYDGNGNLVSQTDDANTDGSRVTQFVYDASGNLIETILPPQGSLMPGGTVSNAASDAGSIDVTYNAFGNAVVSRDANGNYAYDVYDNAGRLVYAIDSNGYVTGYTYDAYGEQTVVTRYATAVDTSTLTGGGNWQDGQPIDMVQMQSLLVTSSSDRAITTVYDSQGNKISVTQPPIAYTLSDGSTATGSPQVNYTYDAYGNVTSQSILVQGTPGQAGAVWATTYNYYNALGQEVMTVDPMGYVTTNVYDAFGDVTSTTEWAISIDTSGLVAGGTQPANPPAGNAATTGLDRTTNYTYDLDGRKASESTLRTYVDAQGQSITAYVTTTYGYDGEGRVTTVTTDGKTTTTAYDALGHVTSVTGPQGNVLVDNWQALLEANPTWDLTNSALYVASSQVVTYTYDGLGNRVSQSIGSTASSKVSNTYYRYDQRGNQVASYVDMDGSGANWTASNLLALPQVQLFTYDANGNLTQTRSVQQGDDGTTTVVLTTNTYDADGQLIATVTQRAGSPLPDKSVSSTYNAFGDTVASGNGVVDSISQVYSNVGELISSTDPKTGIQHIYGYNLAGERVSDTTSVTATRYTFDLDGRIISEVVPSTTSATGSSGNPITATYDRWGNVVTSTDALGHTTSYTYNDRNQVVSQTGAAVAIVGINGVSVTTTPVKTTSYDADGNAIAVTDENGVVTHTHYDAVGRVISVTDGAGATTYTAYDSLGNDAADQDGIGHIVFKDYDALGHVVVQGDFVASANGQSRQLVWQQAYVVDQSGNRLITYDGIGSAYLQAGDTTDAALHANYYGYDSQGRVLWSQDAAQRAASLSSNHGTGTQVNSQPDNPGFEQGNVGWTLADGWSIFEGYGNSGNWSARLDNVGAAGSQTPGSTIINQNQVPVVPGQVISASAQIQQGASDVGHTGAAIQILWYDANGNFISASTGNYVTDGRNGNWNASNVTGTAPSNAAYACLAINGWNISSDPLYADDVSWNYVPSPTITLDPNAPIVVSLPTGTFTQQPANPDFEKGNVGWTTGNAWSIFSGYGYNGSTSSARLDFTGYQDGFVNSSLTNSDRVPVQVGQTINASIAVQQGASAAGMSGAAVQIIWYDANGNVIGVSQGNLVDDGSNGAWHLSSVSGTAPAGAAFAGLSVTGYNLSNDPLYVDGARWDYQYLPSVPTGVIQTTYNYDIDGNLVREVDADGNAETWNYDAYGRVQSHTDLSGANYSYTYDANTGLLNGESDNWSAASQGQSPSPYVTGPITTPDSSTRTYYADGQLASVTYADGSSTTYTYDLNGNLIREEDTTHDGGNQLVHTVTQTTYDSHNRISEVIETNVVTGTTTLDETYSYDAVGNRREVHAVSGSTTTDAWYTYDGDNRVEISDGALTNGQILVTDDTNSYELAYDGNGNTVSRVTKDAQGNIWSQASRYDLRSELTQADYAIDVTTGGTSKGVEEQRTYDADGHVISTVTFYEKGTSLQGRPTRKVNPDDGELETDPGQSTDVSGFLDTATIDHYDNVGRLLSEQDFGHASDWDGSDGDGNLPSQLPGLDDTTYGSLSLQSEVVYQGANATPGYDAVGNVVAYQYREGDGRIDQYEVTYYKKDSYLQAETSGENITNTPNVQPSTDESIYDTRGNLAALNQHTQYAGGSIADNVRMFAYNANGEIIERRDGTATGSTFDQGSDTSHENQHYVFVNGQQVAHYDEGGTLDVLDNVTAFSSTQSGSGDYVVQTGDTLKSIAQAMYGNASLWYIVAQANALSSDSDLAVGQDLTIPQVTTHQNDSTTFKPYNPNDAIGSTTPSLPAIAPPPPPPDRAGGCSAAQIIVIVVTIVVTIVTYGSTSDALIAELGEVGGSVAAGAVAGAAGSIAGQLTGQAEGIQQGFDWGAVAKGAIGGAIGGGVAAEIGGADAASTFGSDSGNGLNIWGNVVEGAADYVGNDVAAKLTGEPEHFSWAGLIASAVSSAVAGEIGPTKAQNDIGLTGEDYIKNIGARAVGDVVNREVSVTLGDNHVPSWSQVGEDILGNAIGQPIGDAIKAPIVAAIHQYQMQQLQSQTNAEISQEISKTADAVNDQIAHQAASAFQSNADKQLNSSIDDWFDNQSATAADSYFAQNDEDAVVPVSGGGPEAMPVPQSGSARPLIAAQPSSLFASLIQSSPAQVLDISNATPAAAVDLPAISVSAKADPESAADPGILSESGADMRLQQFNAKIQHRVDIANYANKYGFAAPPSYANDQQFQEYEILLNKAWKDWSQTSQFNEDKQALEDYSAKQSNFNIASVDERMAKANNIDTWNFLAFNGKVAFLGATAGTGTAVAGGAEALGEYFGGGWLANAAANGVVGSAVGGGSDALAQLGSMAVNYASDGAVGQSSFSGRELLGTTLLGGLVGAGTPLLIGGIKQNLVTTADAALADREVSQAAASSGDVTVAAEAASAPASTYTSTAGSDFLQLSAQASEPTSGLYSSYLSQATSIESGAWEGGFSLGATGGIDASAGQLEAVASVQNGSGQLAAEADVTTGGSGSLGASDVAMAQGGFEPPSAPPGQIVLPPNFGEQASILEEILSPSRLASPVENAPITIEVAPRIPLAGPTPSWQNYLKAEQNVLAGVPDTADILRGIGARGVRNESALTAGQEAQLYRHVDELGLDPADFRISSHFSGYSDNFDVVFLGPNTFPAELRTTTGVFESMSPRAVVAHEAGHLITTRAGTAFEAGSLYDEVGASLTGRQLPGLNNVERYQLLRDAVERSQLEGRSLRDVISEMQGN